MLDRIIPQQSQQQSKESLEKYPGLQKRASVEALPLDDPELIILSQILDKMQTKHNIT